MNSDYARDVLGSGHHLAKGRCRYEHRRDTLLAQALRWCAGFLRSAVTFRHLPSGFNETAQVTAIAAQKRIHRHPGHSLDRKTKQRVYRKPTPITRLVSSIVSLPGAWAASTNMNWCGCAGAWPAGNVQRVLSLVAVQRSNRFSTISSSCSIWRSRRVAIWFHRPFLRGLALSRRSVCAL